MGRLACLLLLLFGMLPARAEELLVIAHPSVPEAALSPDALAAIYLLKTASWRGGEFIVPVNREAQSAERARFSATVLHQSPAALAAFWNQMHFKGKLPPIVQESDQAVLAFVQKVPGAVGYVNAGVAPKNVKVLARVP